ncbi:MAG: hypothetical protein ACLFMX_01780 [Halobacteriales archaeon]
MATALQIALAAGVAVATVNALFKRRDGHEWYAVVRTFLAWFLAFLLAGLAGPIIARWLLTHVF